MITGVVFLHIVALHITGSNNPLGIDVKTPQDTIPFHPYYTAKDSVGICVYLLVFAVIVFFAPNFLGEADNYIPANPLVHTRAHRPGMVLPAVLRHPALGSEQARWRHSDVRLHRDAVLAALARHVAGPQRAVPPDLPPAHVRVVVACVVLLGYVGGKPAEGIWVVIGRVATAYYFLHFLVLLPILGKLERPLPLPESISSPVIKRSMGPPGGGGGPLPQGAAAKPMEKP